MVPKTATIFEAAREAARAAGVILREGFGQVQQGQISYKGDINLVTVYDRRSEEAIAETLRKFFPRHQLLAEEGTTGGGDADHRWVVDPLDGTSNYAHGYPCFAVSIAYEYRGEMTVGVVYDPTREEWFETERGGGALLNGRPIHVSHAQDLLQSMLATGFPYDREQFPQVLARWGRFVHAARAVRRTGSAALDLASVASGRFDGFWEAQLSPWDVAAGLLLVREAGGTVTHFDGQAYRFDHSDLVASNGHIHAAMLDIANA